MLGFTHTKIIGLITLAAFLITSQFSLSARAQDSSGSDESCNTFCYVVLQLGILDYVISAYLRAETELTQIGNSLSSLGATNTAGLTAIQATNSEGFKNIINEAHTLQEKVQTLKVKSSLESAFGSVSDDVCFQTGAIRGGAIDQASDARRASSESVQSFDQTQVASGSARIREWKGIDASPELLAQIFDGIDDLSDNNYSMIVRLVTEYRRYPYPTGSGSNQALAYKQMFRERNEHLKIARAAIMDHLAGNSFPLSDQSTLFSTVVLRGAGASGGTTKRDLVRSLGLSMFGNEASMRISAMQGDELVRILNNEIAKSLYIKAENSALMAQVSEFKGLAAAIDIENHYQNDMLNALDQLN